MGNTQPNGHGPTTTRRLRQRLELKASWNQGQRTPAWNNLWRRILSDVLSQTQSLKISLEKDRDSRVPARRSRR